MKSYASKNIEGFIFTFSSAERLQIEKLKQRFHCKTDSSLFQRLIWFFDNFDNCIFNFQTNINELRSDLNECMGIVTE